MASLIAGWMPPSRENWELVLNISQWSFPILASMQWLTDWYGMGKTSVTSIFNIPGRVAWLTMEAPGFITLLYIMRTLPAQKGIDDLPWQNKVLAGLFVIHYVYRAVAFPFLQPSMSPIHISVWAMAFSFQLFNATSLGSWLAAYGPITESAHVSIPQFALGVSIFYAGLASNYFHDEELREIRRRQQRRQRNSKSVEKHYSIPQAGLFKYVLYPHYLCEWIEWIGFWMACGFGSVPARVFVVNEIFSMLPRAVKGKKWYVERFGEEKIGKRYAIIPGLL